MVYLEYRKRDEQMKKTGCFFGKFLAPHRGHLYQIINASTLCDELYVVVSDNKYESLEKCESAGIKPITLALRLQWLKQELQDMPHVKVVGLDETHIPKYPNGWVEWTNELKRVVPKHIDTFFCGELEYAIELPKYFKGSQVHLFDSGRTKFPISATEVRAEPMKHWDYILGSARPFFAKKVLVVGTESCGKTTLIKNLAKMYHTSWSEEVGRFYAQRYLGGDETIFTPEDFKRIAHLQYEQDLQAVRSCNKITFIDTDAVVTQYYSELYMGEKNHHVESYIDSSRYDIVIMLKPDVEWVDDGQRLNGEQSKREELHERLKQMYIEHGFKNIYEIGGTYNERLKQAVRIVESILD